MIDDKEDVISVYIHSLDMLFYLQVKFVVETMLYILFEFRGGQLTLTDWISVQNSGRCCCVWVLSGWEFIKKSSF